MTLPVLPSARNRRLGKGRSLGLLHTHREGGCPSLPMEAQPPLGKAAFLGPAAHAQGRRLSQPPDGSATAAWESGVPWVCCTRTGKEAVPSLPMDAQPPLGKGAFLGPAAHAQGRRLSQPPDGSATDAWESGVPWVCCTRTGKEAVPSLPLDAQPPLGISWLPGFAIS
jgi:hypothetical protein